MKMKQISDSTIKITIQLEDLEERGMKLLISLSHKKKQKSFSTPFWMNSKCQKASWIAGCLVFV